MKLISIKRLNDLILKPINDKFFEATSMMRCGFVTDEGVYLTTIYPRFISDFRSGCFLINPIIPKWGNQDYSWSIISHDVAFHGYLSFALANDLYLRQGMMASKQIGKRRAGLAGSMVDVFGGSHYSGLNDPIEPPYQRNREYCKIELIDRMPNV